MNLSAQQTAALAALANGIIPADEVDRGAATVNAGPTLAGKIECGINATIYLEGLEVAQTIAVERFGCAIEQLGPPAVHDLLATIRERLPGFFKQLRADVAALYLSDAEVWKRIGFPGPSTATGGYPDFDQPQA
jgi:hypothetical protein